MGHEFHGDGMLLYVMHSFWFSWNILLDPFKPIAFLISGLQPDPYVWISDQIFYIWAIKLKWFSCMTEACKNISSIYHDDELSFSRIPVFRSECCVEFSSLFLVPHGGCESDQNLMDLQHGYEFQGTSFPRKTISREKISANYVSTIMSFFQHLRISKLQRLKPRNVLRAGGSITMVMILS